MEPQTYSTNRDAVAAQLAGLAKLLPLCIAIAGIACVIFGVLTFAGYGTLRFENLPASALVRINGRPVTTPTLELRPGSYQIAVTSPLIEPAYATVHISPFRTTSYRPAVQRRNPDEIASSTIGAIGGTAPVNMFHVRWFDNNTWVAGTALPANTPLALHYSGNAWTVAYIPAAGYTATDLNALPKDVSAYIRQMRSEYAPG